MNNCTDSMLRLIAALLVATGVGSTLYHATMWSGMAMLDASSMTWLCTMLALAYLEGILAYWANKKYKVSAVHQSKLYRGFTTAGNFVAIIWQLFVIQQSDILDDWKRPSYILVLVPLIIVFLLSISFVIDFWRNVKKSKRKNISDASLEQQLKIIIMLIEAFVWAIIAVGFKYVDDNVCNSKSVLALPHVWWHLFTSFAVCLIFVPAFYFRQMYIYQKKEIDVYLYGCVFPFILEQSQTPKTNDAVTSTLNLIKSLAQVPIGGSHGDQSESNSDPEKGEIIQKKTKSSKEAKTRNPDGKDDEDPHYEQMDKNRTNLEASIDQ